MQSDLNLWLSFQIYEVINKLITSLDGCWYSELEFVFLFWKSNKMPSHWWLGAIFTELCNLNISYCKCFIELRWTVIIPGSSMFSSNSTYQHTCLQREQSMHITCQLQNHNLDMMCNHSMFTVLSVIFSRLINKTISKMPM